MPEFDAWGSLETFFASLDQLEAEQQQFSPQLEKSRKRF